MICFIGSILGFAFGIIALVVIQAIFYATKRAKVMRELDQAKKNFEESLKRRQ